MPTIKSGSSGNVANVNDDKQLEVKSIVESEFEFISDQKGLAFVWAGVNYDPDGGDTILHLRNTSSNLELHIDSVTITVDTDTIVQIHLPVASATALAGTEVTGINLNTAKASNIADATAKTDETAITAQGDIIWEHELYAVSGPFVKRYFGALILAKNRALAVDFVSAAGAGSVSIEGHYAPIPTP